MSTTSEITKPKDHTRIDLEDEQERSFWKRKFDCCEAELLEAIKLVGNSAEEVRYLFST
jgi:uncharacterized protein DUF3606